MKVGSLEHIAKVIEERDRLAARLAPICEVYERYKDTDDVWLTHAHAIDCWQAIKAACEEGEGK